MLIYIPVPMSLAMSSVNTVGGGHQYPQQQQQQQQGPPHPQGAEAIPNHSRGPPSSMMCATPTQPPHPHHPQISHPHPTASHQMSGAAGFANIPRLHHCNVHSFLCSNPTLHHQYQVGGGCLGPQRHYPPPLVTTGHPGGPLLAPAASAQLLATPGHPPLYGQHTVSTVQQMGPPPPQPLPPALSGPPQGIPVPPPHHQHNHHHHHQLAGPHPQPPQHHHHQQQPHHHQHHHHHHQQPPTIMTPFPAHTHLHQLHHPHPGSGSTGRGSGVDVLGRALYRGGGQGHVLGRMRGPRGSSSNGLGGSRRSGAWRGALPPGPPAPGPPAPPLPTTAAAATATYPGILLHFLAMLSHPSLHQYSAVEPVVPAETPDTENYEALLHLAERLGEAKPRGLLKTVIDQLPSYRYTGEKCDAKQTTCVICMCDFEPRQMLRVLPCLHEFHTKCVDKWLKSNRTCPICRGDASEFLKEATISE